MTPDPERGARWYRIDATKLSALECYRITRALPTMLRILSARRQGAPFFMGLPVTDTPMVEEPLLGVRREVLDDVAALTAELQALGLERVAILREPQPTRASQGYIFVMADAERRTAAFLRWTGIQAANRIRRHLLLSFVSVSGRDIVVTTTAPPGRQAPPDTHVANVPWSAPAGILARHRTRIPEPDAFEDPGKLALELRRRDVDDLKRRGVLVELAPETLAEQARRSEALAVAPLEAPEPHGRPIFTGAYIATCIAVWAVAGVAHQVVGVLAMPPIGLVTSAAVHYDPIHLFFNVAWLWELGPAAERWLGVPRFALFVLGAALASALLQATVSGPGIGASGVVYALVGYLWMLRRRVPEVRGALSERTIHFALVWLVVGVAITWSGALPIGNAAHAGGLLFGIVAGRPWVAAAPGDDEL